MEIPQDPRRMGLNHTKKGEKQTMKMNKGTVFIKHIKEHLTKGDEGTHATDKVVCKICGKTVEEIYEEYKQNLLYRRIKQ